MYSQVRVLSSPNVKYYEIDSLYDDEDKFEMISLSDHLLRMLPWYVDESDSDSSGETGGESDDSCVGRLGSSSEVTAVVECCTLESEEGYTLHAGVDPESSIKLDKSEDLSARMLKQCAGGAAAKWWRSVAGNTAISRMRFWFTMAFLVTVSVAYTSLVYAVELIAEYDGMDHIDMKNQRMGTRVRNKRFEM